MIRIPMEKWERTLCRLKKHQWQRMGATRTQTVEYTEMALAEDGVTYIDHDMARDGVGAPKQMRGFIQMTARERGPHG